MNNQDTEAARAYHEATKLEYINLRNKPPLFKTYSALPVIPLPTVFPLPDTPTLEAVAGVVGPASGDEADGDVQKRSGSLDLMSVAQLLFYSAGLVRSAKLASGGQVHYRAAASAGALYPIDVYLVCQDLNGLEAGVYHFSPSTFALRPLRKGDYRAELVGATGEDRHLATAPATLVFTATFWRSAWKYRARGYRYCLWDCGTMVANLLALCSALGLPADLVAGFVDNRVDTLLRIRGDQESSICLVPLGSGGEDPPALDLVEPAPLAADPKDALAGQTDYPETRHIHMASCLADETEVADWRASSPNGADRKQRVPDLFLSLVDNERPVSASLGEVINKRGSTRRFSRDTISRLQFEAILSNSTAGIPSDFQRDGGASLLDIYTIVNGVEGVPSGSYFFSPEGRRLEILREGDFRQEAGHLCFEQALGADASAVVFLMADLEEIFQRYGNRGYRVAQLEAGIIGGNVYLSAHSLGLGATGMTFYDDDVTDFFSPHANGKSLMFLVAAGVAGLPNRVRPFRSRVAATLDARARGGTR